MRRPRHRALVRLFFLGVGIAFVSGCTAPGYDFNQDILQTPKLAFEPKLGVFLPQDGDLDSAGTYGLKISYDFQPRASLSLDLNFSSPNDSSQDSPSVTSASQVRTLGSEALSDSQRSSALIGLDWDIPLVKNPRVPYLRTGLGIGVLYIKPGTDAILRSSLNTLIPGANAKAGNKAMFVVRPNVGVRWAPWSDDVVFFGEAAYDYAGSSISIGINSADGDRLQTDRIDFSGISLMAGVGLRF